MIKYAKTDIENGLKYLSLGFYNIITSVSNGIICEFVLNIHINYSIVSGILRTIFPTETITYSKNKINIKSINIIFNKNRIIFNK